MKWDDIMYLIVKLVNYRNPLIGLTNFLLTKIKMYIIIYLWIIHKINLINFSNTFMLNSKVYCTNIIKLY